MKKGQSSAAAGNPTLRSITPLFADHSQLLLGGLMVDEEDKIFQLSSCNNVNMLHFSPDPDASSKCNSDVHVTGGVAKKPRTTQQSSAAHSTFKARREKLGDRITALHQLVSPFGKTDTASVLLEAIGYIKFLESQIESLTQPYLSSGSRSRSQQHPVRKRLHI